MTVVPQGDHGAVVVGSAGAAVMVDIGQHGVDECSGRRIDTSVNQVSKALDAILDRPCFLRVVNRAGASLGWARRLNGP